MTPLLTLVLIRMGLSDQLGYGPVFNSYNKIFKKPCADSLWPTILLYQNYIAAYTETVTQFILFFNGQTYFFPVFEKQLVYFSKLTAFHFLAIGSFNCCSKLQASRQNNSTADITRNCDWILAHVLQQCGTHTCDGWRVSIITSVQALTRNDINLQSPLGTILLWLCAYTSHSVVRRNDIRFYNARMHENRH